ncbi:MAG: extracellular solute-binding protein [Rhodoferax sp.]|uniref:ABC transporter substrate-binding protein n=1 Tax=Rhodoferax sp. TaxID=50421 RepID=UPI00261D9842|nr:extracellular solute-binding protein [Rhodoferax sp.]MDD5332174.1 extracellular solute-binding protein [Rhodoferax sp.]
MPANVPRTVGKILALALWLIAATGWAQAQSQTLSVTAYPAVDEIIRAALPTWNKLHPGVEIKLVSRNFDDHHTVMNTALSTSSNLPDVMVLEFSRVGRYIDGGGLEDLSKPPYNIQKVRSKFIPFAYQQAIAKNGAVMAAPADVGPGTLLYRTDVLKKAGVTEAELTQSWDSFVAAGEKIKAGTGAYLISHARDLKDIVIHANIKPGDGLYFDAAGQVVVDSPRFVHAFELARRVRQHKLDAKVSAWSNEWTQGFKNGTIATQMSGAWLAGHLATWIAPNTSGLWRAAQLPENAWADWGGSFYVIPRGGKNKTLAWDFIQLMTQNRDIQIMAFKTKDAFPALLAAQDDPFYDQPIAFLGGQKARLLWREAALKSSAISVNKLDAIAEEVVNTELDKVLNHGKDIPQALADAKRLLDRRVRR